MIKQIKIDAIDLRVGDVFIGEDDRFVVIGVHKNLNDEAYDSMGYVALSMETGEATTAEALSADAVIEVTRSTALNPRDVRGVVAALDNAINIGNEEICMNTMHARSTHEVGMAMEALFGHYVYWSGDSRRVLITTHAGGRTRTINVHWG